MNRFPVAELAQLVREITDHTTSLEKQASRDGRDATTVVATLGLFRRIKRLAERGGLTSCEQVIKEIEAHHRRHSSKKPTISTLAADARHVRDTLIRSVASPRFLMMKPQHAGYFERYALFGFEVKEAFPSADFDISEAGNCMATDRDTAAVFHLMRAVEWGMRAMCVHLGFRQLKTHTRVGKVKYKPVAYSEWEPILNALQDRVDAKLKQVTRGATKQKLQTFYYPALAEIRAIRDAWRNHVMHTRAEYSSEEADAIFAHVKRLMENLATKVREV